MNRFTSVQRVAVEMFASEENEQKRIIKGIDIPRMIKKIDEHLHKKDFL